MTSWNRGDKIAMFSLVVAIIACIAALVVIPEIRQKIGLDWRPTAQNPLPSRPPEPKEPPPTPDGRIERLKQELKEEIANIDNQIRDVKVRIENVRLLGLRALASNRVEDAKLAVITKVSLENELKQLRQRKADAEECLARLE